jgi:hypothetical protein
LAREFAKMASGPMSTLHSTERSSGFRNRRSERTWAVCAASHVSTSRPECLMSASMAAPTPGSYVFMRVSSRASHAPSAMALPAESIWRSRLPWPFITLTRSLIQIRVFHFPEDKTYACQLEMNFRKAALETCLLLQATGIHNSRHWTQVAADKPGQMVRIHVQCSQRYTDTWADTPGSYACAVSHSTDSHTACNEL